MVTEERVRSALRGVVDPELGINVVDLGLVYDVQVRDAHVRVTMTMTSPACPLGESLTAEAEATIRSAIPEVASVDVRLTWEPRWNPSMMSDTVKAQLGGG